MMTIILYLFGLLLSIVGLFFILINLNLLVAGYTIWQYLGFIFKNMECLTFFGGIGILIAVYERG